MADNKKDNGKNSNDDFDVEDFSDVDFDDTLGDDDFSDVVEDDGVIEEDYEGGWDEADKANSKANSKLYSGGEKKGLSFNTMVIIGAVVLGAGVLGFNIMNESAKQAASQSGGYQPADLSASLSGGNLNTPVEQSTTPSLESASDGVEQQPAVDDGFLSASTETVPPQPAPIAPSENEPLTPMPSADVPRAPDVVVDTAQPMIVPEEAPAETTATVSAQDILKKAMEEREQKAQEENTAPALAESAPEQVQAAAPLQEEIAPAPLSATPVVAGADAEVLKNLEGKIDGLISRLGELESNFNSLNEINTEDIKHIHESIAALKDDVEIVKSKPSVAVEKPAPVKAKPQEKSEESVSAEPAPVKKAPVKAAAAPANSNVRWELRAAQPGRAWLSKQGERDMQSVEIGQTLTGIGRVTAINFANGRWIVSGTQGEVRQ